MADSNEIYKVLQSEKSSSSGKGGSFYSIAAACGMRSRLNDMFPIPDQEEDYELGQTTPTGRPKVSGKRAGAFFHKLQEFWRTGSPDVGNLVVSKDHEDIDYSTAANSFKNYREFYNNDRNFWGTVAAAEALYPATPEQEAAVREVLGDMPFTIRTDLEVDVSEWDSQRIADRHGVYVRPGAWILDYKLVAASVFQKNIDELPSSFQMLSYPLIRNICRPDKPVNGILLDITARVAKAEAKHYALVPAEVNPDSLAVVRHAMKYSATSHAAGLADPFACAGKYGLCIFQKNGLCPRYGSFDEHKERFERALEK